MSVFGVSAIGERWRWTGGGVWASAAVASSANIGEKVRFMASEATIPHDIRVKSHTSCYSRAGSRPLVVSAADAAGGSPSRNWSNWSWELSKYESRNSFKASRRIASRKTAGE